MKVKQLLALSILALAAGAAVADATPMSRAEVAQSVLDARAAGTLIPAGQGELPGYPQPGDTASTLTRAQVEADVLQARARGELIPAGGGSYSKATYARAVAAPSDVTRSEVKAEVLQARADGTLIPAGQGEFTSPEPVMHMARQATPASPTVAMRDAH